jgi:CRP-like cAMP-binding protein
MNRVHTCYAGAASRWFFEYFIRHRVQSPDFSLCRLLGFHPLEQRVPPMTTPSPDPHVNRVLALLPREQYQRLEPDLSETELVQGTILYHQGGKIDHVYFPTAGMVSLVTVMANGGSVEVGVVGRTGMVGIPVVLGDDIAPSQAVVQISGSAIRLPANILQEEIKNGGELQSHLHRFIIAHMKQTSQTAACNRNHRIAQRLAYWLLTCQDTVGGNRVRLTQEFIAPMLGVRRAGIGNAATTLQGQGLIQYSRGDIEILDRASLEKYSCECHSVVREEFRRLLTDPLSLS